jgi:hypothetical protein
LPSLENNATTSPFSLQGTYVYAFPMQKTVQNIPQKSPKSKTFREKKTHIQNSSKIKTIQKLSIKTKH